MKNNRFTKILDDIDMTQLALTGLSGVSFLVLWADSFMYQGFIRKHLLIDARIISVCTLLLLAAAKCQFNRTPHQFLLSVNRYLLLPLLLLLETVGIVGERLIYGNFLYGLIHLDIYQLIYVLVFSYLLAVIYPLDKKLYRNLMVFVGGFIITLAALLIRVKSYLLFVDVVVGDDRPFEWVQTGFFTSALVLSGLITVKLRRLKKSWLLIGIYSFATLALFFLIGEEISWGQRLLGIATPESIKEVNMQNEINIHNLPAFFGYVYWFYIRFTFYCSFAWLLTLPVPKKIKQKYQDWFRLLIPPWYLTSFFVPSFILFYLHRELHYPLNEFEEFNELLIAQALTIFTFINLQWLNHEQEV